jgi:hypothetical protein
MISFDVFDTLITRKTATPNGIFLIMQEILQTQGIPHDIIHEFVYYRRMASVLSRQKYCNADSQDRSLAQIYSVLEELGYINETQSQQLQELELQTELEHVIGIPENIRKLKRFIEAGEHVVLISDMYLDQSVIHKMLHKADPVLATIPLYVSSESRKTKGSGALFSYIKEQEKAVYHNWTHIGDNPHSDNKVPRSLEIHCKRTKAGMLPEVCYRAVKSLPEEVLPQRLTGISKEVCLREQLQGAAKIGAFIGAPILYLYVSWLLNRAEAMGIRRLYFIARDGYLPKRIADQIISCRGSMIETKYIYGSRKAWRSASLTGAKEELKELLDKSFEGTIQTSAELADIFGLSGEELSAFLPEGMDVYASMSRYERGMVISHLREHPDFSMAVVQINQGKRASVQAYLRQELDLSDDHFAFVELSGSGYTQKCLAALLAEQVDTPITTFYCRMERPVSWEGCRFICFDPECRPEGILLEMICRSDHGVTKGYQRISDRIEPILEQTEGDAAKAYGYGEYMRGLLLTTKWYAERNIQEGFAGRKTAKSYFNALLHMPASPEFAFFADMPNNVTGRGQTWSFAPRLSEEDIRRIFYTERYQEQKSYQGSYLNISLLRMNRLEKAVYQDSLESAKRDFDWQLWLRQRFPGQMLKNKIVLYGAGTWGKRYYEFLTHTLGKYIVLWVDQRAECEPSIQPVEGIVSLDEHAYDQLLISVRNVELANEIKEQLAKLNVSNEKVMWFDIGSM